MQARRPRDGGRRIRGLVEGTALSTPGTGGLPSAAAPPLLVEKEDDQAILVGSGGALVVPHEDIDTGQDDDELDLASGLPPAIRKPGRREWIKLARRPELRTTLLVRKRDDDDFDEEYYHVARHLRGPVEGDLRQMRVFVFRPAGGGAFALWPVKATPGSSWYESLQALFSRPDEFFDGHAVRVAADKGLKRYRVWCKPCPAPVPWPGRRTEELLGEALGEARFIRTPGHPAYRELTEGEEIR
jgi:hypothetical protein